MSAVTAGGPYLVSETDGAQSIKIAQIFAGLRRRKLSILLTVFLLNGVAIGLIAAKHAKYAATASVLVDTRKSNFSDLQAIAGATLSDDMTVRSQVDILQSPSLAKDVVERLKLIKEPEFARRIDQHPSWFLSVVRSGADSLHRIAGSQDSLLYRVIEPVASTMHTVATEPPPPTDEEKISQATDLLLDKMTFVNGGRSYVIGIRAKTEKPELSTAIANAYADAYLRHSQDLKADAIRRANLWFDERLSGLQAKMLQAQSDAEAFRQKSGLIENRAAGSNTLPDRPVTIAGQQLAQINLQLMAAASQRAQKEASLAQIQAALQGKGNLDSIPEVVSSLLVHALQEQDAQLSGQVASLAMTRMDANPDLKSLKAQQQEVRRKIGDAVSRIGASIASEVNAARVHEATLRDSLAKIEQQVTGESEAEIHLRELDRVADAARAVYTGYLARYEQTSNEAGMQEPDAVIVNPASVPLDEAVPTKVQLTALAFIVSVLVSLAIAFLRSVFESGTRSTEQLETRTGLPAIGFLPTVKRRQQALRFEQNSAYDEAINTARSVLQFGGGGSRPKVIMVTSALPKEGKTFFIASLARALALSGRTTLLIDCDLRRPAVAATLGLQKGSDMDCVIQKDMGPPRIRKDTITPLDIITVAAEAGCRKPQDLFASPEMQALIDHARERYDLVLLDAPPVLGSADARVLSALADAAIVVVQWGKTPQELVLSAVHSLRACGANILGTVVTQVNMRDLFASEGSLAYIHKKYASYYK
jgi:capsular exopolysaccharide synthesis family protein